MTAALQPPIVVLGPARRRRSPVVPAGGPAVRRPARRPHPGRTHPSRTAWAGSSRLGRWPLVLTAMTALACMVLVAAAALSARQARAVGGGPVLDQASTPAAATVQAGDTLWSIATRVAPARDPRAEVDDLVRLNGITDGLVRPGQVLRLR